MYVCFERRGNGANKDMTCTFVKDSLVPRPKPQGKESGNETLLKNGKGLEIWVELSDSDFAADELL